MADETIKLTITADDKASKPVDALQKKVNKLDGTTAKVDVKADTSAVSSKLDGLKKQITGNIPAAAAVAGSAIAKFALDGAAKFAALGESVQKFSTIAGIGNEAASRWIAVADDYGVGADTISSAVGKLGKTLGTNIDALDKYGVSVALAKDGTVDLTATTFAAIDAYNATTDPAKKAALGTAAFGKSYADLIPLMTNGSTAIKTSMDEVSKSQIFDDGGKKAKAALAYKLAMDDLGDAVTDLQMEIGQKLIPVLVEAAEGFGDMVGPLTSVMDAAGDDSLLKLKKGLELLTNPIVTVAKEADNAYESLQRAFSTPTLAPTIANNLLDLQDNVAETAGSFDVAGAVAADTAQDIEDMAQLSLEAHERLKDAVAKDVDAMKAKWQSLRGELDVDQAILNLAGDFDDLRKAGEDAFTAAKTGAVDAEEKQRAYESKIISSKQEVIDLGEQIGLSLNQTTTLVALVDAGDLDRVEEQIANLRRNNKINMEIIVKGGAGFSGKPVFDAGGVAGPYGGIAGEVGSEILNGRWLTQGPTLVPPGTKVTSRRRTGVWMRRHNIKGYDSGTVGAPIPIGMSNNSQRVTVNINAAVIGNRFDVMRAVKRANFDAARLLGNRP